MLSPFCVMQLAAVLPTANDPKDFKIRLRANRLVPRVVGDQQGPIRDKP